jgi:hypothetical protein
MGKGTIALKPHALAHVQARLPMKVEVFLQENLYNALHQDDPVLHTV